MAVLIIPSRNKRSFGKKGSIKVHEIEYDDYTLWGSFESFARDCYERASMRGLRSEEFKICIPEFLICLLEESRIMVHFNFSGNQNMIRYGAKIFGIEIQPGYEMKFVCFHKYYPAINEEGFYFESPLPNPK